MTQDTQAGAGAQPAPAQQLAAAASTLERLGYTYRGGAEWAPPLGRAPDFNLLDAANNRIAELEAQAAAKCPHQGAEPAPITYMTEDRACTWAWDQVREDVGTEGWTAGDSGTFHGFFLWGWYYRGQYEAQRLAAPPAPAAVAVPAEDMRDKVTLALGLSLAPKGGPSFAWSYLLDSIRELVKCEEELVLLKAGQEMSKARAALAAAPAQPAAWMTPEGDRVVTEATMASARKDGGAMLSSLRPFTVALARAAAPAQAMAAPDHRAAFEMAYAFAWHKHRQGQEKVEELAAEIVSWREGNTYGEDLPRLRFGWEGYQWALATAPVQEHATQLAGQALPADEFRGDTASLVRNIIALLDLDAQGCLVPHGVGGHARGLLSAAASRLAAAPVQPQEDARDPVRALIAAHAEMLEDNAYAYFELAYTRQTGWMAWITDKPLYGAPVVNPDRKVLANGQGDTPDEACAAAARAAQGDTK